METFTVSFDGYLIIEAPSKDEAENMVSDMLAEVTTDFTITDIS